MSDSLVTCPENSVWGQFMASSLNLEFFSIKIDKFADTESSIKIDFKEQNFENKKVFLIWQLYYFLEKSFCDNPINSQIIDLLISIDLIKQNGAKEIICILPYLPYSRQEESVCANFDGPVDLLGKILKTAGVNNIIVFDLHAPEIKKGFAIKITEINTIKFWAKFLQNFKTNICIVSPDKGRIEFDKEIAKLLNADFAHIEKIRIKSDIAVALKLNGDVKNKDAIVIDDIIDTSRTAVSASDILLQNGAKSVTGCFTHAIFAPESFEKIENSNFDKIFITDTIKFNSENLKLRNNKINILSLKDFFKEEFLKILVKK
ncbi:ribose-phosphate diphosphokinase [Candidatus Babeliales bacterium]|nr:ribose-phosphate diphosphokinase [Candidatus Babeliales bacterium]MCF7899392.1 ribose-phosphate diphosphokinase [Candidatus Babeliales bacterium]